MGDDNLGVFNWYNRDFVDALAGNDYLNGHVNADMLWGNAGIDRLEGDTGPDRLLGGPDDDTVWGGEGLDRLWGGWGLDILSGDGGSSPADAGADVILSIENDGVADQIDCGPGRDRAVIRPTDSVTGCERVVRIAR